MGRRPSPRASAEGRVDSRYETFAVATTSGPFAPGVLRIRKSSRPTRSPLTVMVKLPSSSVATWPGNGLRDDGGSERNQRERFHGENIHRMMDRSHGDWQSSVDDRPKR